MCTVECAHIKVMPKMLQLLHMLANKNHAAVSFATCFAHPQKSILEPETNILNNSIAVPANDEDIAEVQRKTAYNLQSDL